MDKHILILGGSGGLSGCLARMADADHEVWALTRGKHPVDNRFHLLTADRNEPDAFAEAVLGAGVRWDAIFDCICMERNHAMQDMEILSKVTDRLIVVSTDSVYDPLYKRIPQNEETDYYDNCHAYARHKREMEEVFQAWQDSSAEHSLRWTIFRPGHIFGPGFLPGCFPLHSRQEELPELIRQGISLKLPAGGIYLTQPIYVEDLARVMMDCVPVKETYGQIFCIGGPEVIENKRYYEILGDILSAPVQIEEIPVSGFAETHPEYAGHLCHRMYDLSRLRFTGIRLPDTDLKAGLTKQIAWLNARGGEGT